MVNPSGTAQGAGELPSEGPRGRSRNYRELVRQVVVDDACGRSVIGVVDRSQVSPVALPWGLKVFRARSCWKLVEFFDGGEYLIIKAIDGYKAAKVRGLVGGLGVSDP